MPLLAWAVRFVSDLADDIIPAYRQWAFLSPQGRRNVDPAWRARRPDQSTVPELLQQVLGLLASHGLGLPGNVGPDGRRRVHWAHLGRLIGHSAGAVQHRRDVLQASGLPIDDGAYLLTPVSGQLDGAPWRSRPITFAEAPILARHLSTACYIVIAYLSGMRSGEVLSLQRGAASMDPATGLWLLRGRHWKGVTGEDGAKLVTGAVRHDPWVVHEVTARAVAVLERLHDHAWLFPDTIYVGQRQRHLHHRHRVGDARPDVSINRDLGLFTGWVNRYCQAAGRGDSIPADPTGPLTTSRFRRTLAWHIVRQPRGLVAAAIQYGHVKVCITQGYAGSADSGFLDELSFENWLLRLEQFADAYRSLLAGQAVSGPAAAEYRRRVGDVAARFPGRVLRTTRQAGQLLRDPALQVFPGRGMHCVFNALPAPARRRPPRHPRPRRLPVPVPRDRPHRRRHRRAPRPAPPARGRARRPALARAPARTRPGASRTPAHPQRPSPTSTGDRMSTLDTEREQIVRTAEALLAGQVPGPLTVVRLAEAAGLKRWILTHRHPDLMRDFQERAAHINRENPEILKLRERLVALDRENRQLRARLRDLDDLVARYAQSSTSSRTNARKPALRRQPT